MDTQNQEMREEPVKEQPQAETDAVDETPVPRKRKKKKTGLIIILVILVLAVAAGIGYYIYESRQPVNTVKAFLGDVQKMDFEGMKSRLQSSDMSALDNADITNDAYKAFFQTVNKKMTFKIGKTKFSLANGTASVTAHIKYIDGSDIYKETITEFLKQIVSTAFSGKQLTEEETMAKLASLLEEKSGTVKDKYAEADVTYPVIKAGNTWKIVSLDEATVRLMSANFTNVQDEINQTIEEAENPDSKDQAAEAPQATADGTIDMTNEKFTIHYKQHRIANDYAGSPCLLVYYDYSNNGTTASSAMVDVNLQAYQNGELLTAAIPEADDDAIDQFMAEVQPGQSVTVCQAFSLKDESDVTLQAGEAFSFGGGTITSQILKIKTK